MIVMAFGLPRPLTRVTRPSVAQERGRRPAGPARFRATGAGEACSDGLRIAESLRSKVPWQPWRFGASDYLEAAARIRTRPDTMRLPLRAAYRITLGRNPQRGDDRARPGDRGGSCRRSAAGGPARLTRPHRPVGSARRSIPTCGLWTRSFRLTQVVGGAAAGVAGSSAPAFAPLAQVTPCAGALLSYPPPET